MQVEIDVMIDNKRGVRSFAMLMMLILCYINAIIASADDSTLTCLKISVIDIQIFAALRLLYYVC